MSSSQTSYPNWASNSDAGTFFPSMDASSSSFQINPGSMLPHHPRSPSSSPTRSHLQLGGHGGAPRSRTTTLTGGTVRTPRTSLVSGAAPLASTTKAVKANGGVNWDDDDADDKEGDSEKKVMPRKEEVWRDILETAYGRDKAFKLLQYSLKVYLLFHLRSASYFHQPRGGQVINRVQSAVKGLSLTRKCMVMFNWLTPLLQITSPSQESIPFQQKKKTSVKSSQSSLSLTSPTLLHRFLHAPPPLLLDLVGAFSQDIYTLSILGLVGKRVGDQAEKITSWAWFCSTLAGLVEIGAERAMVKGLMNQVEERLYAATMGDLTASSIMQDTSADEAELERLKKQYGWLQVSQMKLLMDLTFVSYDLFKVKRAREVVMVCSGLFAAILSTAKVFDKHQNILLKANDS